MISAAQPFGESQSREQSVAHLVQQEREADHLAKASCWRRTWERSLRAVRSRRRHPLTKPDGVRQLPDGSLELRKDLVAYVRHDHIDQPADLNAREVPASLGELYVRGYRKIDLTFRRLGAGRPNTEPQYLVAVLSAVPCTRIDDLDTFDIDSLNRLLRQDRGDNVKSSVLVNDVEFPQQPERMLERIRVLRVPTLVRLKVTEKALVAERERLDLCAFPIGGLAPEDWKRGVEALPVAAIRDRELAGEVIEGGHEVVRYIADDRSPLEWTVRDILRKATENSLVFSS